MKRLAICLLLLSACTREYPKTEYGSFTPAMYTTCKAQCDSIKMELDRVRMFVTSGINTDKARKWCTVTVACDCQKIENKRAIKVTISTDDVMIGNNSAYDGLFDDTPWKSCVENN